MTTDIGALAANYPIAFSLGESGREIRAEGHGFDVGAIFLVMGTWDCECSESYIHWTERMGGEDECGDCGMREEDMPESRLYEIASDISNCRPGFMSDEERSAFLLTFESEGWGDRMRAHFAVNKAAWDALADKSAAAQCA